MDQQLIELLSNLPLHSVLFLALLGLWRDNKKLHAKVEECLKSNQAAGPKIDETATILPVSPRKE